VGENAGVLGLPRSDVISLPEPTGCTKSTCALARFEGGSIYFKAGIGDGSAHELHGYVLDYYLASGEVSGHLGFPVTDVTLEQDGSTWARFEPGLTVTCSPSGNCAEG
jgi:uncharacterized protein with LGFP repeats